MTIDDHIFLTQNKQISANHFIKMKNWAQQVWKDEGQAAVSVTWF